MTISDRDDEMPVSLPGNESNGRFAAALRWGGAGAVGLSGFIYLLQGVDHIDAAFRNWVYLGLMAVLLGGGLVSRLSMKDAKGARLFFALAVTVIPVQFAQLGGMIHELVAVDGGFSWLDFSGVTLGSTTLVGAATALLLIPVGYMGFSVLARSEARRLTLAFTGVNALLLIPARDSLAGLAVPVALAAIALVLEKRYFASEKAPSVFRTLEGAAARAIFLVPLGIAMTRFGLHGETLTGYCALAALVGMLSVNCGVWIRNHYIKESAILSGTIVISMAWYLFARHAVWMNDSVTAFPHVFEFAPIAVLLFSVTTKTPAYARFYRGAASLLLTILASQVFLVDHSFVDVAVIIAAGAALGTFGFVRKYRGPLLAGIAMTTIGVCAVIVPAIGQITVSLWILLAGLGVVLVLVSSAIERYGRHALRSGLKAFAQVREWQ